MISVHAALTPDSRVLTYGTKGNGQQTGYFIYDVWDPSFGLTGGHMTFDNLTETDIFCSSQIILPQTGEILISGGDNWTGTGTTNQGNNNSNIFDYGSNTLARSINMNYPRWYSSSTVLVDGEVYIQGGNGGGDFPEVRETTGGFRLLSAAPTGSYARLFPRNFLAPDGRVFGYDTNGNMYFVDASGTGTLSPAGQFNSTYAGWTSGATLFQPGKILQMGGNSNGAIIIDINGPQPTWTPTASMLTKRMWVSATVLPDGKVLANNGSEVDNKLTNVNTTAAIWDPDTGEWHVGASGALARLYHSSALLLPDASVLIAGGGAPGPLNNTNAEIYYPPYLYASGGGFATRPQIVSAPTVADVGDNLAVQVDSSIIDRVTLVKSGSVTHSVNMDQRFLELSFTVSSNMLDVSLPARASDTPPGFYQMFVLNDAGVPSMAKMLRINIDSTPDVSVDYTPTIGGGGGGAFQLACNADEILVGVHGKYDTYVNQIGPQCITMDQLGRWIGDPVDRPVTGNSTSGTVFSKTCPRDYAMSGFRGRADQYLNQIEVECRALTSTGGLTGPAQYLGGDGGSGGTAQGPHSCGTENPVYALYGRSGGWLDDIGVQCRPGVITPISINSTPVVVNPGTQNGFVNVAVNKQISASDGDGDDLTFSATGLPTGLSIDVDGLITGTPTTAATYNTIVTADDGTETADENFLWNIDLALPLSVDQMPIALPELANTIVSYTATAHDGVNPVFKWNFGDGTAETAYSSSSSVAHTFAQPGVYNVTLTVNDDVGVPIVQSFSQRAHLPLVANSRNKSTNIVYEDGASPNDRVWVANQDANTVSVFDAALNTKIDEIPVGTAPRALAIAPDGRVWVINKSDASISIIDDITLNVVQTIPMPYASKPYGIVFSALANEAYVVLEGTGELLKLDATTASELGSVDVGAHPRHLAINGTKIYVSRFVTPRQPGEETATVQSEVLGVKHGGEVVLVDSASMLVLSTIVLEHSNEPDFENQGRGVPNYLGAAAISPDGTMAWVPSKQDNIKRGTLRDGNNINFQNTVRAVSSRIDLASDLEVYPGRIDHDNASLASAAIFDHLGIHLFVALETSREVAVIDPYTGGQRFRFNVGIAPQGLALSTDSRTLYVNNFMDRTVGVFDLADLQDNGQYNVPSVATLPSVDTELLSPNVLLGKQLFYDAERDDLARDNYMSCAVCHNDGGQDGRVWDLTGMGEGLRNTISLEGHGAPGNGPLHWSANFDEVQDFEGQIRGLSEGTGLMADVIFNFDTRSQPLGIPKAGLSPDLDALAAYVNSLTTHSKSPFRNSDGTLTADGLAGKAIFDASGCAACHTGAALTDSVYDAMHDVGTIQQPGSGQRLASGLVTALDTPTLHGVWDTGPYLHDGSANTMAESVTAHQAVSLSGPDTDLVVAYLEQIDALEPAPSDGDSDGAADSIDNCVDVSNGPLAPGPAGSQFDTDGDGYGNMCDADFNNNGVVDSNDAAKIFSAFGAQFGIDAGYDPAYDLNSNGVIDSNDASTLFGSFGQPPGPSAIAP